VKSKYIIGSRGSELALWQSNWAKSELEKIYPGIYVEVKIIKTTGDKILDVPLSNIGDKGLFTKEIENSLINKEIDIAVHSLKDLPTALPEGLTVGAVSERIEQRDVLISKICSRIDDLPIESKVATGSLRRKSQLLNFRPDLNIVDLRGNVTTRIKKFEESDWAAIILAFAGVKRLGLDKYIKEIIPVEVILPAVSQGVMALEIRDGDKEVFEIVRAINNNRSELEIRAERSFLKTLQGGCQVPIGVYSRIEDGTFTLEGMVGSVDGKVVIRDKITGSTVNSEKLGEELAGALIQQGAAKILELIRVN
jgi:hydroxymethylbilane synthase